MKRREFITLLGGAAAAWPVGARAQQAAKVPRIGYLALGPASARIGWVKALRSGLRDLGYVEGRNIVIEFRWADGVDQLPQLAAELVQMEVDVIFAPTSTYVEAAQRATKTIPIVFANHADPVGIGHVASLGHPGGNSTGLTMLLTDLSAKELQMLKEVVPQATRIGVLWNPTTPSHPAAVHAVEAAGEKLRIALHIVPVRTVDDFDPAFETMTRERVGGFLDIVSPLSFSHRAALAALALKHRLPGAFGFREFVDMGGLISYGADVNDLHRRAAVYIDKILKGIKPANLPVEQASKYQLVINLKTARALGLEVPPMLLALADEVIE
jgi:putative tryptophan/tyrosine transport system substrate-binding protein